MKAVAIKAFGRPEGLARHRPPRPGSRRRAGADRHRGDRRRRCRRRDPQRCLAAYGFKEGHIPGSEVAGTVTAVGDGVDPSWIGRRVWAFTGTGRRLRRAGHRAGRGHPPAAGGAVRRRRGDARQFRRGGPFRPRPRPLRGRGVGAGTRRGRQHRDHGGPARGPRRRRRGGGHDLVGRARRAPARARRDPRARPLRRGRRTLRRATTSSSTWSPARTCRRSSPGSTRTAAWWSSALSRAAAGRLRRGDDGGIPEVAVVRHLQRGYGPRADRHAVRTEHFTAASRGEMRAVVHEVLPLDQAALAHRKMDAGEVFGRIVLTP